MSHWFHRNPLKATSPVGYELKQVLTTTDTGKICSELRLCRIKLLDLLRDPNNDASVVEGEFSNYASLMNGFLFSFDDKSGDSKLRPIVRYKWTMSMLGYTPNELNDGWFEVLNMTVNMGMWLMKHAAKVAAKDEVNENEAKEVHKCLRKAAGMFTCVRNEVSRINEQPEKGSDFDPQVISAYVLQSTAEAQEVTVARAMELKHTASLVSALANETAKLFRQADDSLSQQDAAIFDKWRKYLQLKAQFYLAFAYSYCAKSLLAEDKCGEAIRSSREAQKCVENSEKLCQEYAKCKGVGLTAKPETHLFFRQLKAETKRSLDQCERENGLIYHQAVPDVVPELEIKATYGLVKPDDFQFSAPNPLWTPQTYNAFDITKAPMPDFSKSKKGEKELPAVSETPVYQTDKDPKNSSGCILS